MRRRSTWLARGTRRPTAELQALDALKAAGEWEFQGRVLKLTNLDKVLFPAHADDEPVTKRELVRYHAMVAPYMLRYLTNRPLNQHRFPNGAGRPGFWHKALPKYAPDWITRWHNPEADPGETEWYAVADSPPTLAWLANYGALELHPWTSTVEDVHRPTWAFIDIDPGPENTFDDVLVLARLYRTALDHLNVVGGPKVTGQRGIQIWIPVATDYSFDDTRAWVETISRAIGATVPELVSWAWKKTDRRGLARLDFTQNAINRTLVAPFSARPAPGAPVSVPITWEELDDPELRPDRWTIRTVLDRLDAAGDPLADLVGRQQTLPRCNPVRTEVLAVLSARRRQHDPEDLGREIGRSSPRRAVSSPADTPGRRSWRPGSRGGGPASGTASSPVGSTFGPRLRARLRRGSKQHPWPARSHPPR